MSDEPEHGWIEHVRLRPMMYIGGADERGLREILDVLLRNALDLWLRGEVSAIEVVLHDDGSLSVLDDGPGYSEQALDRDPVSPHPTPWADGHVSTVGYLGLDAICALSAWLEVHTERDGRAHSRRFARGQPDGPAQTAPSQALRGSEIRLQIDSEILDLRWSASTIRPRLDELRQLCPGLRLRLRTPEHDEPFGIATDLTGLLPQPDSPRLGAPISLAFDAPNGERARVALAWHHDHTPAKLLGWVCLRSLRHAGGSHHMGFRRGLRAALRSLAGGVRLPRRLGPLMEGLTAAISVDVLEPAFEGALQQRLNSWAAAHLVARCLLEQLPAAVRARPVLQRLLELKTAVLLAPDDPGPRRVLEDWLAEQRGASRM